MRRSGLPASIVRVTWAFGPGMTPDTHLRRLTSMVAAGHPLSRVAFPGRVSVVAGINEGTTIASG